MGKAGRHTAEQTGATERLYGGLTAEERRADRRRRLMDSGLELFGTDGYPQTGIERICSHAGVTARHFYDEFGSRENLLRAVYDEIVSTSLDAVAEAVQAAPLDTVESTRAGIEAFLHSMLDDQRRARIQCVEAIGVSREFELHRREVLHLWAQLVATQGLALGVGPTIDERSRFAGALALVGGTNELLIDYLTSPAAQRPSLAVLTSDLVHLFVAVSRADVPLSPPASKPPGTRTTRAKPKR